MRRNTRFVTGSRTLAVRANFLARRDLIHGAKIGPNSQPSAPRRPSPPVCNGPTSDNRNLVCAKPSHTRKVAGSIPSRDHQ
jgi:hypothetical protein